MIVRISSLALLALLVIGCSSTPSHKAYHYHTTADDPNAGFFTLELPPDVRLLGINGSRTGHDMFKLSRQPTEITIRPGKAKVQVRYEAMFGDGDQLTKHNRSTPFTLDVDGKDGEYFVLGFVRPRSIRTARRFARAPEFWLE
jgi:hypothetical protein